MLQRGDSRIASAEVRFRKRLPCRAVAPPLLELEGGAIFGSSVAVGAQPHDGRQPEPAVEDRMSLDVSTRIGPYKIVALIGTGGMGEVYRARDSRLDRSVAIKVLTGSRGVERSELESVQA